MNAATIMIETTKTAGRHGGKTATLPSDVVSTLLSDPALRWVAARVRRNPLYKRGRMPR